METFETKRERLRHELQDAYDAWLQITEARANATPPHSHVEPSGSPQETQPEWLEYLAAKERLVLAYAEERSAAA